MALFNRKPTNLGKSQSSQPKLRQINLSEDDPYSDNFNPSVGDDSRSLVNYLLSVQVRKHGQEISKELLLTYGMTTLQRQAKRMLTKYDPLLIKRATRIASDRCDHTFTWKYVERLIKELKL